MGPTKAVRASRINGNKIHEVIALTKESKTDKTRANPITMNQTRLLCLLLLTKIFSSVSDSPVWEQRKDADSPPLKAGSTITEVMDPVYGYTNKNGDIVDVDVLPPKIAAEQAAPIDNPLPDNNAGGEAAASEPDATITEYVDAVYGYTDKNGDIVEVDVLPPEIAAEQAAPIRNPLSDSVEEVVDAVPKVDTTITEYMDPVYGYTDENGNIVEVDVLPADITAEQASPIDNPLPEDNVDDENEDIVDGTPSITEYWEPVYGYTDENGNIVEVAELPSEIAAKQASPIDAPEIETTETVRSESFMGDLEEPLANVGDRERISCLSNIVLLAAMGCLFLLGPEFFLRRLSCADDNRNFNDTSNEGYVPIKKPGKAVPTECIDMTEYSETCTSSLRDGDDLVVMIKPIYEDEEAPVDYSDLSCAIAKMRRIEQEAVDLHEDDEHVCVI